MENLSKYESFLTVLSDYIATVIIQSLLYNLTSILIAWYFPIVALLLHYLDFYSLSD